jgi:quercetin dioxygenase-like cupin family protein
MFLSMSEESVRANAGRFLVTGVDESGHSCASRDEQVRLQGGPGLDSILYSMMYATPSLPAISAGGGRVAETLDLGVSVGAMDWKVIDYAAGVEFPMHHTDTIDFDIVLSGSIELILDDGVHPLVAGDQVVVTGVDHAWCVGPEGCRISVISLGVPAPR